MADAVSIDGQRTFDAAFNAMIAHLYGQHHGRKFYVSRTAVELVCARRGEVLFDGPAFEDGDGSGFDLWSHRPHRHPRPQRRRRLGHG